MSWKKNEFAKQYRLWTLARYKVNFQDVLIQKECENCPLWSDEGVYHTAKEIQLLYQQKFSNIFLGIGGFHLEKVVICCLNTYLESSGIQNLVTEEKIYGPVNVNSLISGGNYFWDKRGMSLIAEVIEQLQVYCSYGLLMVGYFLNYLTKSTNLLS